MLLPRDVVPFVLGKAVEEDQPHPLPVRQDRPVTASLALSRSGNPLLEKEPPSRASTRPRSTSSAAARSI